MHLAHMTRLHTLEITQNDNMRPTSFDLPESLHTTLRNYIVHRQAFFVDESLLTVRHCQKLETLSLYWLPLTGAIFPRLLAMKNLKNVTLKRFGAF